MRTVTENILLALVVWSQAKTVMTKHNHRSQDQMNRNSTSMLASQSLKLVYESMGKLADNLVDRLSDKALKVSPLHQSDLDNTVLSKRAATLVPDLLPSDLTLAKFKEKEASRLGLTGKTLGEGGKYLLCKDPLVSSTDGQPRIYRAYLSDGNGNPVGNQLVIKLSNNREDLLREADNYDRATSGFFRGSFVNKVDFLHELEHFDQQCALVIEAGQGDLKDILAKRGGRALEGRALRDAAAAAAQCMQAMHSSGIVWTDLKTENFVVMGDGIGDGGSLPGVKAIDVESAMPLGSFASDYTPHFTPPELARTLGTPAMKTFVVDYSYDIWSYGMLLYELATGRNYFVGKAPKAIIEDLASEDFEVDVSDVLDNQLRNLIQQCLNIDATKRPNIVQILLHPYFITTGVSNAFGALAPAPADQLKRDLVVTGQTAAKGKYLLCENVKESASGRFQVYYAYRSDPNGNPIGKELVMKVSSDCAALSREADNHHRVSSGAYPGRFVKKFEYLTQLDAQPTDPIFDKKCALVTEAGQGSLGDILAKRGGRGLEGQALRNAVAAAAQCVQAVHSSGIVWTDLKAKNFVFMGDETRASGDLAEVKGINLENAMPHGMKPIKFYPERCPPEFTRTWLSGATLSLADVASFRLDYSFDIWSYGMLLYELVTGRRYFFGKGAKQIAQTMASEGFKVDLRFVRDDKLRDLIERCLAFNPEKRPTIGEVMLHDYFEGHDWIHRTVAQLNDEQVARVRDINLALGVTEKTLANGKYFLGEPLQRVASGSSTQIYLGYRSDPAGDPIIETRLAIKISSDCEAVSHEADHYDRITSGLYAGRFVKKVEYLPEVDTNTDRALDKQCALIVETGRQNLKDILIERGERGLEGRLLRRAARAAARCIQAVHAAGLVWAFIKARNFVVMGDTSGPMAGIKGIDLENAMPRGSTVTIWNPETSPPELARIAVSGKSKDLENFALEYSFDIWSYGMLLYRLGTGQRYFYGKNSKQIARALASKDFAADLSDIQNDGLRDLIQQCLNPIPEQRPNIVGVLLHPFLETNTDPFLGTNEPNAKSGKAWMPKLRLPAEVKAKLVPRVRTGQTIAKGKYILRENPDQPNSGRFQVYDARRSDPNGKPIGTELKVKVMRDCETLSREANNYDRIISSAFPDRFVSKLEFLAEINALPAAPALEKQCALVVESGQRDLKGILADLGPQGLEGRFLRDAARAVAKCIQALHAAGIVWTNYGLRNFVIMGDWIGDHGNLAGIKGIDVGDAMLHGSKPSRFRPDTCPPEFARVLGRSHDLNSFALDYSFDIWIYGILLYELGTGRRYFSNKAANEITQALASEEFEVDLSDVRDPKLRDLIGQCLNLDPERRPTIAMVLHHPSLEDC